ncbi:hypothetical protein TCAL_07813 [Tigriopus californicus]|uniref:Uncharacterized protein n=1 Tax=Tigriopus californicus TaxID=6832 RepID=A0A553NNN1_TIGCA|nr:uncharacterized protein LOC131879805 [Tigriopus californicus]TRY67053.1 hypothetical protein TCAL_07813 [Tigriopus californicus]
MTSTWRNSLRGFFTQNSGSANVTTDSDETRLFRRSSLRPNQRVASDIERESQKVRILSISSSSSEFDDLSQMNSNKKVILRRHSNYDDVPSFVQRSVAKIERGSFGMKRSSDQSVSLSGLSPSSPMPDENDHVETQNSQDEAFLRQESTQSNRFTTSEESSSDDDDEEDDEGDTHTLGNGSDCGGLASSSLQTSTLTLVLDSQSEILEEDSVAGRLIRVFDEDLENIVNNIVGMPDGTRKLHFLQEIVRSLRALKTDVTINSHFILLSSLVCQPIMEMDEEPFESVVVH